MTKKPDITTIASGYYSRQALNTNFENIQDSFDNTLSLDGSVPNSMSGDIDMGSNDILNADLITTSSLRLDGTSVTASGLSAAGASLSSDNHTGNGSTKVFSMSYNPFIKDNTQVYINGLYQEKSSYSISGTNLTFVTAPANSAKIEIVVSRTLDFGATDASNVAYTQGSTNSVNRTVLAKLQESVSVKDFGAVGDGSTNDTLAFQRAANSGKVLFIPEGTYILTSQINFTGSPTIRGEGIRESVLQWAGSNGISIVGNANEFDPVNISNLSLRTTGSAAGQAIRIVNTAQIGSSSGVINGRTYGRLNITNVSCTGATNNTFTNGWQRGLYCTDVIHATIDKFHFTGKHADGDAGTINSVDGIKFDGDGAPVEIVIKDSWVFHSVNGIDIGKSEGIFISQCNLINCNIGVFFQATGLEPQLNLIGNHINANINCVRCQYLAQGNISQNLFYARSTAPGNVTGVTLISSRYVMITNNIFVDTQTGNDFNAVVVNSDGLACLVKDNVFQKATTAIWLQSGSSGVRVGENVFNTIATNRILDQSSMSYVKGSNTLARRTTTTTIASGTSLTPVTWQASDFEYNNSWSGSNPTRLTAHASGRYRVSATIVFPENATGFRRAAITRNGSTVRGFPLVVMNAVSGLGTTISTGEFTVDLTDGQYIELEIAQNSGSTLTLPVGESHLKLEFVRE